jgi:hypothetical protein
MKTYAKYANALGIVTAVLMGAFLAAYSAESAAQGSTPPAASASSAVMWVQTDSKGNRYLYYMQDGKPVLAGPLGAILAQCPNGCRPTPFGCGC